MEGGGANPGWVLTLLEVAMWALWALVVVAAISWIRGEWKQARKRKADAEAQRKNAPPDDKPG